MPARVRIVLSLALLVALAVVWGRAPFASDHDDTDTMKAMSRHEGRITDLFAFTKDDRLVLILCTNPTIPKSAATYVQPSDLVLRFHVTSRAKVTFDDPQANAEFGGTIKHPEKIAPEHTLQITFDAAGEPTLATDIGRPHLESMRLFSGLRDDPFIRGPRRERNVAAIVLEAPLKAFTERGDTLLIWGTSTLPSPLGPMSDLAGRSLRSQFAENMGLNDLTPAEHFTVMGVRPDVVIFDTIRPASFPNGRGLDDDVVDLVGDARILATDSPFPTANDRPFLTEFPYLAEPHAPCGATGLACCAIGEACGGSSCVSGICTP